MRKFRLLKDLPYTKAGIIYTQLNDNDGGTYNYVSERLNDGTVDYLNKNYIESKPEWFEEVIEEKLPKYKVGDYVVSDRLEIFLKINSIFKDYNGEYRYSHGTRGYYEHELRLPTQEELKKYFR